MRDFWSVAAAIWRAGKRLGTFRPVNNAAGTISPDALGNLRRGAPDARSVLTLRLTLKARKRPFRQINGAQLAAGIGQESSCNLPLNTSQPIGHVNDCPSAALAREGPG